ncbi:unnamed protein product [Adineta ricciae]|uniref:Uncharacterized protein n=1 Tax=Adineta ricciae TaxID=249248 RepID=A0A814H4C2_ADIRI|nr:unnamed protein product [Adineta ricciae]CAF1005635.1 unnamed protein product [Adineta ricciae]
MPSDKRLSKIGLWLCLPLLLILSAYLYIGSDLVHQPRYSLEQKLVSSNTSTSTSTKASLLDGNQLLNGTPNEGFVTYVDNSRLYYNLLIQLLDSIHYFSTRPIIAYGIDIDLDFDTKKYPRLIQRRLNKSNCGRSVFFCKIHAIIESKLDYGIQIDADSVVNWNIDILFDVIHRWPYSFPLAPRHPTPPNNMDSFFKAFQLDKKNRSMPYVHAQFSWNYRAYPFFIRALRYMREGNFLGANYDESAVNVFLWKDRVQHTLCRIDPFVEYLPAYENQEQTCGKSCHAAFMIIHGAKDASIARRSFKHLRKLKRLPFIQTPSHGFHYLNETQFTCCEPDSQPSSIHPLICEYPHWKLGN